MARCGIAALPSSKFFQFFSFPVLKKRNQDLDYAMKYRKDGKKIMLIGVNFDFVKGNISDWIKEEYR